MKNTLKYVKYCLKTKNDYLKTWTKHPLSYLAFKNGEKEEVSLGGF